MRTPSEISGCAGSSGTPHSDKEKMMNLFHRLATGHIDTAFLILALATIALIALAVKAFR